MRQKRSEKIRHVNVPSRSAEQAIRNEVVTDRGRRVRGSINLKSSLLQPLAKNGRSEKAIMVSFVVAEVSHYYAKAVAPAREIRSTQNQKTSRSENTGHFPQQLFRGDYMLNDFEHDDSIEMRCAEHGQPLV